MDPCRWVVSLCEPQPRRALPHRFRSALVDPIPARGSGSALSGPWVPPPRAAGGHQTPDTPCRRPPGPATGTPSPPPSSRAPLRSLASSPPDPLSREAPQTASRPPDECSYQTDPPEGRSSSRTTPLRRKGAGHRAPASRESTLTRTPCARSSRPPGGRGGGGGLPDRLRSAVALGSRLPGDAQQRGDLLPGGMTPVHVASVHGNALLNQRSHLDQEPQPLTTGIGSLERRREHEQGLSRGRGQGDRSTTLRTGGGHLTKLPRRCEERNLGCAVLRASQRRWI